MLTRRRFLYGTEIAFFRDKYSIFRLAPDAVLGLDIVCNIAKDE